MADLHLSFAMTPYDRMLPLIHGEVKPDGITLEYQGMPGAVPGVFYDQLKFQRYDVSEMSFSSFLIDRAKGWPYRILPVFHNRNFSYTSIAIRRASGIRQDHPEDLKGKRFAIGDYQQTGGLWIRGVLLHEFDVKPQDMVWYQTRGQNYSHTGASGTSRRWSCITRRRDRHAVHARRIDAAWGMGGGGGEIHRRLGETTSTFAATGFLLAILRPQGRSYSLLPEDGHLPAASHDRRPRKHHPGAPLGRPQPDGGFRKVQEHRHAAHAPADAVRVWRALSGGSPVDAWS
jgi:hypothetical protein